MPHHRTCSECGQPLPGGASEALCPICALRSITDHDSQLELPAGEHARPVAEEARPGIRHRASGIPHADSSSPAATSPAPLLRSVGDYELLEEIARGGMGVVFRARQKSLNRIVALKLVMGGPLASAAALQRFQAEAQAAASLQHPNIVAIHEVGEHGGQAFFSMDYVAGHNLAELLRKGPLPPRRAAGYVKTTAQAIEYAHQRGILHRDLKPSNVLIDQFDQPRITDFGLAKRLESAQPGTPNPELTMSGQVVGSPNFMAPEQAQGRHRDVGPPSDVYSLGALLYDLITGRPPFQAATLTEVLRQVAMTEPAAPRLLNSSIPRDLETICLKCLEKDLHKRYPTAQMLAEELGRFLDGQPILARPIGPAGKAWRGCRRNPRLSVAAGAALLSVLVGLVGVTWQWRRAEAEGLLARRHAYAADMKEVQRALDDSDLGRARALLDRHRPERSPIANRQSPIDLRCWEWRYLWARCQSEERFTLHQYSNAVSAVAFSSDGKWLAVLRENSLALWEGVAHRQTATLPAQGVPGHGGHKAVAFSPRGNLLAWGHQDSSGTPVVRLRDVGAQQDMAPLPHSHRVVSLAFSPDVKAMATLAYDGTVRVWDLASAGVVTQFVTAPVNMGSDRFSAKARVRVTSVADATGRRRELESQPVPTDFITSAVFTEHYGCVLFSPDDRWLAIGEARPQVRLRDRATGNERIIPVPPPADGITALAFSPDSRRLAAGCGAVDHDIHLWDLAGGTEVRLAGHSGWVAALAFSPNGQTLASASSDQTVRLWDLTRHGDSRPLQGNVDEVWALAWSPDGQSLVTGARDGSVRYWDPAAKPAAPYQVLPESVHFWGPTFFPDSRTFLTTTRPEGAVVRWDTGSAQAVERLSFLGTNHTALDLSPDGRWLALADAAGNVQIWGLPRGRMVTNLVFPDANIFSLWFSPRGNLLACGAYVSDDRVDGKLWAVSGWHEVSLPPAFNEKNVLDGNFSPDERTLAIGYADGTAAWWDLTTGQRKDFFDCQSSSAVHAVFSPDGRHFATGGLDGLMTLWDVATRQPKPIGRGHRNALHDLLFSPDSRRLLASGTSPKGVIKFWDVETGRDVATLLGVPGWFPHIGFSPDGNTLFAASLEGTALFWRAPSFEEIAQRESQQTGLKSSKRP